MAIGTINGIRSNDNKFQIELRQSFGKVSKGAGPAFYFNSPSDGEIYAVSSNPDIASIQGYIHHMPNTSIDGAIIVSANNYGSAVIYIGQAAGTGDYADKTPEVVAVYVQVMPSVGDTLNTTSWSVISEVAQLGIGDQYWSIGDTKEITLNGTIGTLALDNFNCKVFILHFNYPINNVADNNIIFGGFKHDDYTDDIALADSKYNSSSSDGTLYFNMMHWGQYNYGGWKGCDFRYDILGATSTPPSDYGYANDMTREGYDATSATLTNPKENTLLAALPNDFRNRLRLWSRWIDAVGGSSNIEENIEETIDAVTLLTEFEVAGSRNNANQYEQNHQSQMDYYRLGNSKTRCRHNSSSWSGWWFASPYAGGPWYFTSINGAGGLRVDMCNNSECIAPAFKI